jgi:eukaryotic-like serine/threonine-protein kinase
MESFGDILGQVIGGCRVERLLGQGGMSAVYKAQHVALDIPVALKLLLPSALENHCAAERFFQEARAAAKLRHPAIIGVMDVGIDQGYYFLIMEYCDGRNLTTMIDKGKKGIPIPLAVKITEQILDGIEYAHKNGIIHRDIKPENILIFKSGRAKLADLGLIKDLNNQLILTQTNMIVGSPDYIAPEQAQNPRSIDGRADLYAIGCTLFHMLTGKPPFSGSSAVKVIFSHIKSPVPNILERCPALKEPIALVIYKLLEKDPKNRFNCAADTRVALMEAFDLQQSAVYSKSSVNKKGIAATSFAAWKSIFLICSILLILGAISVAILIVLQSF